MRERCIREGRGLHRVMTEYSLERMIGLATAMSAQKDSDRLLEMILIEAMEITGCDAGTIYTRGKDGLEFHTVITLSKGIRCSGDEVGLPPVPMDRQHVCACAALQHEQIRIRDIYASEEYDFSGARRYDSLNDYHTQSMFVIPMEDEHSRIIGVLQLINALDRDGNVTEFSEETEPLLNAFASLAAVCLDNRRLTQNVSDLLHSFVEVMIGAIDERTPYNANHTRSMVLYGERFIKWLEESGQEWQFSEERKEAFLMSVWLHDVGKLITPPEVMDKPTRLGSLLKDVHNRITVAILMERIRGLEDDSCADLSNSRQEELREIERQISEANGKGYLSEEEITKLQSFGEIQCMDADGRKIPLLTEAEMEALTVQKGTLTGRERGIMQEHVVHTARMLEKMSFEGNYEEVPFWAGSHHELLDGSGYPLHLKADRIPREVRLLTIIDVYDALTAEDRPYKKPMPPERAFSVLEEMRDEGKIDGEILAMFLESGAWRR